MQAVRQIGGYDMMILKVGYIFQSKIESDLCEVAAGYEIEGSRLINVNTALEVLEDKQADGTITEIEQRLLVLCQAAEAEGIGDIVINSE